MAQSVLPGQKVRILGCLFSLLLIGSAYAQTQDADRITATAAPATRADQIEAQRLQKAATLQPDTPSPLEQRLNRIEDNKLVERVTCQLDGWCVHFGGLIPGAGPSAGPEYINRGLLNGAATFRGDVSVSTQRFWKAESDLFFPHLADDHVFLDLNATHRNYPHIDYYGPGPDSRQNTQTDYFLQDTTLQVSPGVRPFNHLRIGALGRYLLNNIGPGRDHSLPSTDQVFAEAITPGLQFQTNFVEAGGFVQYDWRDNPGGPRRGGNYYAEYAVYTDVDRGGYSFRWMDLDTQQYFSFFNQRRVIALRGRVQAAQPQSGDRVPFYLQPTLGGPDTLRGFAPFRFYDNASLLLTGEYRWEVFSGLDMALFTDAGQVFPDWRQINVQNLNVDAGFGFRFNVRNDVFLRLDTGFSREGFQLWLRFGNPF
jgi:outer membrane protein assembly factor BamA